MASSIKYFLAIILHLFCGNLAFGQVIREDIEDLIESTIKDDDFLAQNESYDLLPGILDHPIDLNSDEIEILSEVQILTPLHINALKTYIRANGPLLSTYELQAVPHFGIGIIRAIFPYITINPKSSIAHLPLGKGLLQGSNEVMFRWGQVLEKQPAYNQTSGLTQFNGSKSRLYFRYRFQIPGKLYAGLTAEKDPGEELFKGSNPYGFDFYSYHLYIKNFKAWIPKIAIGDYSISIGHGLIINSGFTLGKSALTIRLTSARQTLRPYTSVGEHSFSRGIAFEIKPFKKLSATLFFSRKTDDASVHIDTTVSNNGNIQIDQFFSSFQTSGLHRTDSEIKNRNQVNRITTGGTIQLSLKRLQIDLNVVHHSFDFALTPSTTNKIPNRFSGSHLTNISISYSYNFHNLYFFGETAMSQNKTFSSVNGILLALDRKVDIAVLGRFIPPSYHQFEARSFGESSSAENETGMYIGLEVRPFEHWTINAFADIWEHTRPKYGVDGPGQGAEQLLRITYQKRHHSVFYIQYRHELKDKNSTMTDLHFDQVVAHNRQYLRLQYNHKVGGGIELRNRFEFSFYKEQNQETRKGILIYQDLIYKPLESPFTFTGRIAFFDTDDYLTRIYAFENDLSYQFSVPAYSYRGVRYYLNLKYTGIRNFTIEARIAQLRLYDRDLIGSGNLQINGNTKTEVKVQVRIKI